MNEHEWMRDPEHRGEGLVCRNCGVTEEEGDRLGMERCASAPGPDMTEPWNFTEAQRRQFRVARGAEAPDFTTWTLDRLTAHKRHLEGILVVSAGQRDPLRPQLRAEYKAVCAAIDSRSDSTVDGEGSDLD